MRGQADVNPFLASGSLRRLTAWTVAVALLLLTSISRSEQIPQGETGAARLDGLVVDGTRLAQTQEAGLAIVTRNGVREEAYPGMTLQPGDRFDTGPRAYAVIRFPSGTVLVMRPSSGGRVGSLTDFVGEVFVKVSGSFSVDTTFVRAGARDTAYLVRTHSRGTTSVMVVGGIVEVSSATGAWPTVPLSTGMITLAHPHVPEPTPANVEDLSRTQDWVERVERLVAAPTGASRSADTATEFAAAIAASILLSRDKATPDPGDPDSTLPPTRGTRTPNMPRRCAAAALAPFPWPSPPQPSVTAIVPQYLLFPPEGKATTLADVAARLEGAIARAGYQQSKYLGAGCDGFAIVLDLEHIEVDGTRMRGSVGFAPPSQDEPFSLATYIKRLFYAPPGQYRQIVLLVSEQRMAQATAPPTEAQLRAIARDGISALPTGFSGVPYTSQHVVQALIYEFEKGPRDGDAKLIPAEGRLGGTVHLKKAQLF